MGEEKEKKKEGERKELTTEDIQKLMNAVKKGVAVLGTIGIALSLIGTGIKNTSLQLGGVALLIVVTVFFLFGIRVIKRPKMWVMQVLGQFYDTYYAGIHWFCPFLTKREAELTEAIFEIKLFTEKPTMNFKGGGSAVLIEPTGWFKIENPEAAVYDVEDYIGATKEAEEDTIRTVMYNTRVEDIVGSLEEKDTETTKTFEEFKEIIGDSFSNRLRDTVKSTLAKTFSDYGLKMAGRELTITDYGWSEEVVDIMKTIYKQRQQKIISQHTAEARRIEIGDAIGEITKTLEENFGYPKDEARKVAPEIFKHITASDKGQLKLIKWESTGEGISLPEIMAKVMTAIEMFGGPKKGEEEEKKKPSEEEDWVH
ncbi:hypothetical protein KAT95_03060 [Candidatus Parcubacteria bacterium]|nr:hypothetical protein [Candidatus Parcubacteria bacterium]